MKRVLALATGLVLCASSGWALNVTTTGDAMTLVNTILGSGFTVANATYTGAAIASGTFTNGNTTGMGIDAGIVLTSGNANYVANTSNTSDAITGNNGQPGDSDLNGLIPGYTTHDAAILEFDFSFTGAASKDMFFAYAFGSDEYNEWVGSAFNDVFGFFLDGVNIALIPGTSTPVSINNVNLSNNSAFYNNNDPSSGVPTPYAFEYDGFTDVFVAQALGLAPDTTYHIKLAIADAGDFILDSGVFIKAGSFGDVNPVIPEPGTLLLLGSGLLGLAGYSRKRAK